MGCKEVLISFVKRESADTSIFCFQEADPEARRVLRQVLSTFAEHAQDKDVPTSNGLNVATYVSPDVTVLRTCALLSEIPDAGLALILDIRCKGQDLCVANVHGISFRGDDVKLDTEGRLVQTERLIDAGGEVPHPVVIGGNFNLLPEALSIQAFARFGYQDLVANYNIATTRNRLAWESPILC